jgi:superfamily II DNA or RNA helicase
MKLQLFDYQFTACDAIISHIQGGNNTVLVVAPTGSGKSKIATALVDYGLNKKYKILFAVTINTLIEQTLEHFNDLNVLGVIGDRSVYPDPTIGSNGGVIIGSLQSIAVRPEWLSGWDMVVFDEAHTSAFYGVAQQLEASIKIGLTATPKRGDKRIMAEVFSRAVIVATHQELTERGYLTELEYYGLVPENLPDLSNVKVTQSGEYDLEQLETVCNTEFAIHRALDARNQFAGDVPTLAFCTTVKHVEHTVRIAQERGIKAAGIVGNTKNRKALFERLRSGDLTMLVSCKALSTGTDLPFVKCGLLMFPHLTEAPHIQEIGRIARKFKGKTHGIIIDAVGNCNDLGLAHEKIWTPEQALGLHQTKKVTPRQCPFCYAYNSNTAKTCKNCGAELTAHDARERTTSKKKEASDVKGKFIKITTSALGRLKNGLAETSEYRDYWRSLLQDAYHGGDIRGAFKRYVRHEFPKHPKPEQSWGLHAVLGDNPSPDEVNQFKAHVIRSSFAVAENKREWWRSQTIRNELGAGTSNKTLSASQTGNKTEPVRPVGGRFSIRKPIY